MQSDHGSTLMPRVWLPGDCRFGPVIVGVEQVPLLFFRISAGADGLAVAQSLRGGSPHPGVEALKPGHLLETLKATRGFAGLKIALPHFSLDNPRLDAAMEGTAVETHVAVHFYGNFDKLAGPLFKAWTGQGLACYSVWDGKFLQKWPKWEEPRIDKGFAARMSRVLERKSVELRRTVTDERERTKILDAFVKSPDFRAEMAKEARLEAAGGDRGKKTYSEYLNCFVRWKDGSPSAAELGAVRKLVPKFANMGLNELRRVVGESPRLLLLTALPPRRAAEFRGEAERQGLVVEMDRP